MAQRGFGLPDLVSHSFFSRLATSHSLFPHLLQLLALAPKFRRSAPKCRSSIVGARLASDSSTPPPRKPFRKPFKLAEIGKGHPWATGFFTGNDFGMSHA